ncbi:hypothetical protein ADK93_34730 [Streptomyces sp. XY58]|nr:hypothetical protein ADK93_34730 [Streptomyces sp. XY58]KOV02396.1 hypothetical protein ADK89_29310 [Streptomyces sp. XY37]KOV40987.1 hypothetical protein ADK99_33330 [Streptomyces sp. MMG1064]
MTNRADLDRMRECVRDAYVPAVACLMCRRPAHEVTGISARDGSRTGNGQVFGLAGTPAGLPAGTYWPSLPRTVLRSQCV